MHPQVADCDKGKPAVSIVMPVLDGAKWLSQALDSLLHQTRRDIEIIILDGGSKDGSTAIASQAALTDPRIRFLEQPGTALVDRLNEGIHLARADLIARMDADDIALPGRLAAQVEAFAADPDLVLLGSAIFVTDATGQTRRMQTYPTDDARLRTDLLETCPFAHPTMMFRTSAARAVGGYRIAYEGAEDHDLWLRLSETGRLANLRLPLLLYRRHDAAMSVSEPMRQALASAAAVEEHLARSDGVGPLWPIGPPVTLDDAVSRLDQGRQVAFRLNLHRALMFGEAMRTADGRAICMEFVTGWQLNDPTPAENCRFADIALRGAVQAWRFGHHLYAVHLVLRTAARAPRETISAVLHAMRQQR